MRLLLSFSVMVLAFGAPATAQRQATPEQRIDQLERQLRQVQGRIFQRGQPVDTAGFDYEPAAPLSAVTNVTERLVSIERQMAEIQRLSEENGNRLRALEGQISRASNDQTNRIAALEQRVQELGAGPVGAAPQPSASMPSGTTNPPRASSTPSTSAPRSPVGTAAADDPAEEAYSAGFRLWQGGQHQDAISSLRSFVRDYPSHRRVSWANNLIGRALLDSGQPREAANALLNNYRSNPKGERAPDSLYYLGQSLMRLGQAPQACNAYSELDAVYGDAMRADLKRLVTDAKVQAGCR
jgi:TolA-binding protein